MASKFGRNYQLSVGLQDGTTLKVSLPFTVEFEIVRNILTSANTMHIRIYNLSARNRNQIRYNFYDTGTLRPVKINAGYGDGVLPQVFTGNITQAWSVREGSNFVTTIEAFDGGFAFANATTNIPFPSGTPQQTIISTMAESLSNYGVAVGAIGSYPGTISRGNTYSGSTTDILRELTGGGFYIDNGKVNCLGNSECINGGIPLINAASGLLNTPVLQQTILSFDMLFEPGVISGQKIQLVSATDATFNGFYKVISIKHRVMISAAVCGDAVTSLEMFYGTAALVPVGLL